VSGGFGELYWILLQVLAWVFSRAPELVARCGTDAREDRRHAEGLVLPRDGRPVKVPPVEMPGRPRSTLTIALAVALRRATTRTVSSDSSDQVQGGLGIEQEEEPPLPAGFSLAVPPTPSVKFEFDTIDAAEDEIVGRFRRGELVVIGRFMGLGARVPIPVDDLFDAQIDWDRNCIVGKAPDRWWKGPPRWWSDVLVERLAVLRLWPPDMGPPQTELLSTTETTAPTPTVRPPSKAVREMLAKYDELVEANQDFANKMAGAQHKQILADLNITGERLPANYSYTTYRRAVRLWRRDGKPFRPKKSSGC
jgi:hypothetical protein